ncbi:hypothetical protein EMIHUDRAFT_107562 [Emiliania huxleyi CCMP1516]|uniref:Alanine racemase N-terminal domain-containing protein n=2 Tax=Emiliania huxleyi TaxID=2903 RepID=A0A0D3I056_EMIH1|nr:hypothetical protein EMIHUDRAFT_107562 [Emiliania huxleyi CCMP1516]EOD04641.1 hypothetical protein EMIHUDRAFT_107562 [Emiliania huxleyi CCMP1516]|eukprot:XP_005757070.1 hypothetical protein EMIHUDRAFT_107562 [Emiliania huxleyi CCMP1516]
MLITDVVTPALVLDLARTQRNAAAMVAAVGGRAAIRTHGKALKSSALARYLGLKHVCAQTVVEAECMVRGGCTDVLLTNQLVGKDKLHRLALLAATPSLRLGVLVDSRCQIEALSAAAETRGVEIDAYVEVDAGQNRCGVSAPEAALALASAISASGRLRRHSIDVPCVTGGGTGTFPYELEGGVHTELQPGARLAEMPPRSAQLSWRSADTYAEIHRGSYLFMDGDYGQNEPFPPAARGAAFAQSLFVQTAARPPPPRVIVVDGHVMDVSSL